MDMTELVNIALDAMVFWRGHCWNYSWSAHYYKDHPLVDLYII